jgi:hypothetical protein
MNRLIACVMMLGLTVCQAPAGAVNGNKAQYVGGTVSGLQDKAEGSLLTNDEVAIRFTSKNGNAEIPYASIDNLEYGQKAGRRIGVAIMVSPLALFSKKRNHYLTIGFKDAAGKQQVAVFELGKNIVRTALKIIETRSGKQIEYQDDEARKSGLGGK